MNDHHLPAEGQTCEVCQESGHNWCRETELDTRWTGLFVQLHDEIFRAVGEAA